MEILTVTKTVRKYHAAPLILCLMLSAAAPARDSKPASASTAPAPARLSIREVRYDGRLSDDEGRFTVEIDAEAAGTGESSVELFEGDVAVLPGKLADDLKIVREGNRYTLIAAHPGRFKFKLDLVARIQRAEPWNRISFAGAAATIASVTAQAGGEGIEIQLLTGTVLESTKTNGIARVRGFLGTDQTVALRWQGKTAEVTRKTLLTVDSTIQAQFTPTVIKYTSQLHYEIVQGNAAQLTLALPATQALTRLAGEQIRNWRLTTQGDRQVLAIDFIKPVEKSCDITLYSEQALDGGSPAGTCSSLNPPQPLEIERESGSVALFAEDTLIEIESIAGLRQVNAPDKALTAYRFNARPFTLALKLKRIQPVIDVADRISARLEETRLTVSHSLTLDVQKAGIYSVDLTPPPGFVVADVRSDGVEDWKASGGRLSVSFSSRVLGARRLDVLLEQAHKTFPDRIRLAPLRVAGAARETARIGAAAAPGIRLNNAELSGLREIPVRLLQSTAGVPPAPFSDEVLAYTSDQPDWTLSLASERLAARVAADVFNLVTIGDGIVSGSATVRYGLVNQGVQEFKVRLPSYCRNVEFTGPNIRRKEVSRGLADVPSSRPSAFDTNEVVWTVGLQDKAWGGYTLVVTYDYQFDPNSAEARAQGVTLPIGGVHTPDAEHETGSIAITTAASLELGANTVSGTLRRLDDAELPTADRSLITRAIVLAYQYTGNQYNLAVNVKRYAEEPILDAVADRTQITSVLGESGEMLTQASFMVKNNEKQFQGFELPKGATLWGCYVNGQPAKPERNGGQVLVPLPRDTNRDQAFAVDILYAQTNGALASHWSKTLELSAPRTDVPNTYAEWKLFVPPSVRLSSFEGSMTVARGTTSELLDAWRKFLALYFQVLREAGGAILIIGFLALLVVALAIAAARRGWNGIVTLLGVAVLLAVLGAMLLPALSRAKRKSQLNNQLGGRTLASYPVSTAGAWGMAAAASGGEVHGVDIDGYNNDSGLSALSPAAKGPTAAGIRSIRIELPQTGQPFLFTKVLNLHREPLSIRARVMSLRTYQTLQMTWQVAAFLLGLAAGWWQWRRTRRGSLVLTLALALILGSVCSLLIQWRALHGALIIGFPILTMAVIAWLVWKSWPRSHRPEPGSTPSPKPPHLGNLPPVTAAIALGFSLCFASVSKASEANDGLFTNDNGSLVSASYAGTVSDRVALLDAVLRFSSARAGQTIPLFGEDVALKQFTVTKGAAKVVRDGKNIAVRLSSRGEVTLQVNMLVKVAGDVTKRHLAFNIPPALSSRVTLAVEEPEADVDFPTAISFKRIPDKDKTRVEAVIGSGDHVELLWTPRVKRAAEVAATVFCRNTSLVTFGGGMINVRATLDYQVTQGELRQARVRLPQGQRLLRVEGPSLRTWELRTDNGTTVLVVDLLKGIPLGWQLAVETERVLDALPASAPVDVPHALEVKRETGLVALRNADELELSVESASGLQRVDAEEFARAGLRREEGASAPQAGPDKADGLFTVFRFLKPEFGLRVRAEAVRPQVEAVVRNILRVGAEEVTLSATIDYTIKRVGVFALKVALPSGYRVESVVGDNVLQWIERAESGPWRELEVALKERTSGDYKLRIELTRNVKELPGSLAVACVHPLDTAKLAGFVAVSAEPGVAVKTESFDGLTEIPAASLPAGSLSSGNPAEAGGVLAYKFISPEPKSTPEWKLGVSTEMVEASLRAEIVNTITLTETLAAGRTLVRFDIANSPVKELRVRVPAAFRNVEISGPNIRSREQAGEVWRVELQSKTRESCTLTVTWELPRASGTNAVELAGVSAEGVERETGLIAVGAKAPLQVSELDAGDLQRVDTGDFPDWAGRPATATALAYRYVRPGYRLRLDTRRFGEAEVLQALVDNARFTTVVAADGQLMTEMSLSVRNNGRQFLEIELPPGGRVWSAFVAGRPVRPSQRSGKLLLPLESTGADEGTALVELTYAGTNAFPRARGTAEFLSPKFDVPLKNARWELFLPPDYDYRKFAGTMTHETATLPSSTTRFSLLDYSRMEKASNESARTEARREVSEAQRQLAGGNVREATANFNRAKGRVYTGKDDEAEVRKLESDLKSAQASNLIIAQSEFTSHNADKIEPGKNAAAPSGQLGLRYDTLAAEQQWTKLQQAQEVASARVQPLRVNLPLRGLRCAFTQVLQTEIGKPMTIRVYAASAKAVSWPKRTGAALACFLALWGLVALALRAVSRQNYPAPVGV